MMAGKEGKGCEIGKGGCAIGWDGEMLSGLRKQAVLDKAGDSMDGNEAEKIIEAALFMSSKPLAAAELGKLIGVAAPGFVAQRLDALKGRYEASGSAIEIALEEGKYHMRLRQQYVPFVKDFAKDSEISRHALRTLAYISKNDGVKKSDLCKRLGSAIYSDVAELAAKGFLAQKKSGRSTLLSTTQKFRDYFGQQ